MSLQVTKWKAVMSTLNWVTWLVGCCMVFSECGDNNSTNPVIETGTVTDHEGHSYRTVKIGDQWWMAENLAVTTFRSGNPIKRIEDKSAWAATLEPAYSTYNNNNSGYGPLYNFYVIASGEEIAPEGWHIPTDDDWKTLESYIGLSPGELNLTNWRGTDEGDKLKEETTTTTGWNFYEGIWGTNETGFTAGGGSCRVFNGEWGIPGIRYSGFWWSSSADGGCGWYRYLDYKKSGIFRFCAIPNYGFSLRCVRNK